MTTAELLASVSRETRERLDIFVNSLRRWQKTLNLVSERTLADLEARHVADCYQLALVPARPGSWIDLGSGAGLPGLILAARWPDRMMHLVESDRRKCAFLRQTAHAMNVCVTVWEDRIERAINRIAPDAAPAAVTARALAPLSVLLAYAQPILARGTEGIFPKGRAYVRELTGAHESWKFDSEVVPSITDQDGAIIRITIFMGGGAEANTAGPAHSWQPQPGAPMPRILALANQKGGVGKTTTAINLGTALSAIGERVLIVDLDPQGNASTGLGIDRRRRAVSTYHVLTEVTGLSEAIQPTAVPSLSLAPSTMDLLGLELEIATRPDRARRLRQGIADLHAREPGRFTYILIDCPPSLNLLTVNALAASNAVLVPLQCEFFALEGLSQILKTVEQVRSTVNPTLSIHGIVLTMFDPRNNLANQVAADVRQFMGRKVYDTVIPRNVRVSEAPSHGKPVLLYDLKCTGSQAYLRLASEIIQRERELKVAA